MLPERAFLNVHIRESEQELEELVIGITRADDNRTIRWNTDFVGMDEELGCRVWR